MTDVIVTRGDQIISVTVAGAVGPTGLKLVGTPEPGQFVVFTADREVQGASGTGADAGLRTDLAAPNGAALTGTSQGAGTPARSVQTVLRERVTTSGFGSDGAALQKAIDTGAREVIVNNDISLSSTINLRSNQILRFAGGRILVAASSSLAYPGAVLYSINGENITIIDPVIDASARPATASITGIHLINPSGGRVYGGALKRCNIMLESYDVVIWRNVNVVDTTVDMDGFLGTAVYISGIRGVAIRAVETMRGLEGFGVYNGARAIAFSDCRAHNHQQDGFLINAGQEITHVNCFAYDNGQSGFTSQRFATGDDTRISSWMGCHANNNAYDGFDLRGKVSAPAFGRTTAFVLTCCVARANVRCGFYIVLSEGTTLDGCVGILNKLQNLNIENSDQTVASGFRSISGSSEIETGINKCGIIVYNSNMVQLIAPISTNAEGAHQDYGISFTGTSMGGRAIGGDLSNNNTGPFFAPQNAIIAASADTLGGAGVFFLEMSALGTFREEGTVVPTHARPKGSQYIRTNGGNGELYLSNGSGSWSRVALV